MDFAVLRGTLKKNLCIQLRAYPVSFFVGSLLTGLYTALGAWFMYHLLFAKGISSDFVGYTGTKDYMSYVIIGSLVYIFVVRTCLNVSRSLITELREGTYESLMLAPFHRIEYFFGNMLVQTVTTSFEVFLSLLIGIPFGLRLSSVNVVSFLGAFFVALYAFFGVSMILGCIMLYTRDTYISQNTLFAFLFLVCGVTFPAQYLPAWLQTLAHFIPVTGSITLIRNTTLCGMSLAGQIPNVLFLLFISTLYVIIGFYFMKRTEQIALEKIQG